MSRSLVVDSSTLIALERANLIKFLRRIDYNIIIPKAVKEEIKNEKIIKLCKIQELRGRTLRLSKSLEHLNIGKGEAQCCALAQRLKLKFIICDDRKFIRQRFLLDNKHLQSIKILGFSFFLHLFYMSVNRKAISEHARKSLIFDKKRLIDDVWKHLDKIIELNNWERSEVLVANYTFLKEMGY